jgi:hypothetical protein
MGAKAMMTAGERELLLEILEDLSPKGELLRRWRVGIHFEAEHGRLNRAPAEVDGRWHDGCLKNNGIIYETVYSKVYNSQK